MWAKACKRHPRPLCWRSRVAGKRPACAPAHHSTSDAPAAAPALLLAASSSNELLDDKLSTPAPSFEAFESRAHCPPPPS